MLPSNLKWCLKQLFGSLLWILPLISSFHLNLLSTDISFSTLCYLLISFFQFLPYTMNQTVIEWAWLLYLFLPLPKLAVCGSISCVLVFRIFLGVLAFCHKRCIQADRSQQSGMTWVDGCVFNTLGQPSKISTPFILEMPNTEKSGQTCYLSC